MTKYCRGGSVSDTLIISYNGYRRYLQQGGQCVKICCEWGYSGMRRYDTDRIKTDQLYPTETKVKGLPDILYLNHGNFVYGVQKSGLRRQR